LHLIIYANQAEGVNILRYFWSLFTPECL